LLNASVGVQRVIGRLKPGPRRSPLATRIHRRTLHAARSASDRLAGTVRPAAAHPIVAAGAAGFSARNTTARLRLRVGSRIGPEAIVPVAVAVIVLAGSLLSVLPDAVPAGAIGGPNGDGAAARVAVGGEGSVLGAFDEAGEPIVTGGELVGRFRVIDPEAYAVEEEPEITTEPAVDGAFLDDGTLVKPVAVETSVADGRDLIRSYTVKSGDTLVTIADAHDVSMMTVWWANKLTSKDDLHVGQVLTIPPVTGLVATVKEGDTLDSLAAKYKIGTDQIYETNGLEDRTLVIGQTLVLPGAAGAPIPTPKPTPKPVTKTRVGTSPRVSGPATYSGGAFSWPVVGGGNYISQYFRYGHYGLDIAADYGSSVRAAADGTVTFAGWKGNGGGYQVWISHGSGLYTTYNHMSAVTVGAGQSVGKGQQVGRIGQSGWATGPHLHFEVWRGAIWNGGKRVNPLLYL
jgi:murein DD-endopeptidase MepM/ murein hydrolase activator NlpD